MTSSSSKTDTSVTTEVAIKKPEFYKLIIHNDDSTPIDVVMYILCTVCSKSEQEAKQITIEAHESGAAVVGIFIKNKANNMRDSGMSLANQFGFSEFTITTEKTD